MDVGGGGDDDERINRIYHLAWKLENLFIFLKYMT